MDVVDYAATDEIGMAEDAQVIHRLLDDVLSYRERLVIERRYGLGEQSKELSTRLETPFNVTRERIRQIQDASLKKLHDALGQARRLGVVLAFPVTSLRWPDFEEAIYWI